LGRVLEIQDKIKSMDDLITKTPNGYAAVSALFVIQNKAMEQVRQFSTEFGMSPSARGRVTASSPQIPLPFLDTKETTDKGNPWDKV
jgi:phage terminase small subunit